MRKALVLACASVLLAAPGCATIDPYRQRGTWRPEAVNERNLAVMAANLPDLARGHGEPRPQPRRAVSAVNRLLAGAPTPLPSLSSDVEPGQGGSAAPASNAGSAGAQPAAGPS